jgi:hypothetical protein
MAQRGFLALCQTLLVLGCLERFGSRVSAD